VTESYVGWSLLNLGLAAFKIVERPLCGLSKSSDWAFAEREDPRLASWSPDDAWRPPWVRVAV
jgi:hypothetical protein